MKFSFQPIFLIASITATVSVPARAVDETDAKRETLESIRQTTLNHYKRLVALKVLTRSWYVDEPKSAVTYRIAAQGSSRLESIWHTSREEDCYTDPASLTRFYDGTHFNLFHHFERRYEVTTKHAVQTYYVKIQVHPIYECMGWWPPGDTNPPPRRNGEPDYLVDILNDARAQLSPKVDSIDGQSCRVVEIPNVVRLWIDPALGVIRRRQQLGAGPEGPASILATYNFSDFRSHREGIWLPYRFSRQFATSKLATEHVVDEYAVNENVDGLFQFKPPPGSLVYDRDTDTYSQVPGGLDWLEVVARRVIEQSAEEPKVTPKAGLLGLPMMLGLVFVAGVCIPILRMSH